MNALSLRNTHAATVAAVLGSHRRVESTGTSFYNRDRFVVLEFLRSLFAQRCRDGIGQAVRDANAYVVPDPVICIAATPDSVDPRMVQVLLGGTYHEAWHSLWSCTRDLIESEMVALFDTPLLDQIWDFENPLKTLINVIEDIRIEQLGRHRFPGSLSRLECLQDFILDLEGDAEQIETQDPFSFVLCGIRDLGLGYSTLLSRKRLAIYQQSPYWSTLESLSSQVQQAQTLMEMDMLGSTRLALECLPTLLPLLYHQSNPGEKCLSSGQALSDWSLSLPADPMSWDDQLVRHESIEFTSSGGAELLSQIRPLTTYTKTQVRTLFKSWEQTATVYGTASGTLSTRMMIDSAVCLRSGLMPNRGYQQTDLQQDTSVAATILLDLSGSMVDHVQWLAQIAAVLFDSFTGIGAPVEILGYEGDSYVNLWTLARFGESPSKVYPRLCALKRYINYNDGCTPTAKGLTWALSSIAKRRETHRFVFVVTDGHPNDGDDEIIPKILAQTPIPVIGVGVGYQGSYVKTGFPQFVWSEDVQNVPRLVVQMIRQLLRQNVNKS